MICQAHLVQVRGAFPQLQAAGATVLAITPSRPEVLAAHSRSRNWPFPVVGDPDRSAYRAFGLGRTSLGRFLHPRALFHYVGLMLRGWFPRLPARGEDVLQLGGDFLLDRERRVRFAHASTHPTDRPSMGQLLNEVGKLRNPPP